MATFLFYDIETSGLNPSFDQVLTFAAIRTDLALNEIERHNIIVNLRKDIVPSPMAFLTHKLTFEELEKGVCEYEAAKQIHSLINVPGTISLGYNSLGFDDEFLRFLFYRNLFDVYSHQYLNGCKRMDVLPITVIFRVFHPDGIVWPEVDGKPSLKLELLTRENKYHTSGRAHEAMNDVEALIGLSRQLKQTHEIWNYCLDFFNKNRDENRIRKIDTFCEIGPEKFQLCLMASASFGPGLNYLVPVINIGQSKSYTNQNLWVRLDLDDILGIKTDIPIEETFVVRKRFGDLPIVLPAIDRFWNKLTSDVHELVKNNIELLSGNMIRFKQFIDFHQTFKYPLIQRIDSDADLYQGGFFSVDEKKEIKLFHQAVDNDLSSFFNTVKSSRIRHLAMRINERNFMKPQDNLENDEYENYLNRMRSDDVEDQIIGYKGEVKLTSGQALKELDKVRKELENPSSEENQMLTWLNDYISRF